jgi:hypothetical protein
VGILDLDGNGQLDVLVLDRENAVLRTYRNISSGGVELADPNVVRLPAAGVSIHATGCPKAPAVIVLADGRLAVLSGDGETDTAAAELTPIKQVASTGAQLAIASEATGNISLFDACTGADHFLGLPGGMPADVAFARADARSSALALLDQDGKTVRLIRLSGW